MVLADEIDMLLATVNPPADGGVSGNTSVLAFVGLAVLVVIVGAIVLYSRRKK